MTEAMLNAQLNEERFVAVHTQPFFSTLRQVMAVSEDGGEWAQLAHMHYRSCADANACWDRFERDCLRLSRLLEYGDTVTPTRPCAIQCIQAASDYVIRGIDGPLWRATPRIIRARALFALVSMSEIPLQRALSCRAAKSNPSITEMREALERAGDMSGCLMV